MTKIRWTLKEQATLVEACCRMLKSGVAESNLQAIRKAQGILVEGRRRDIITIGMVPWLEAAVRDRQAIEAEASRKADLERNRTKWVDEALEYADPHLEPSATVRPIRPLAKP